MNSHFQELAIKIGHLYILCCTVMKKKASDSQRSETGSILLSCIIKIGWKMIKILEMVKDVQKTL